MTVETPQFSDEAVVLTVHTRSDAGYPWVGKFGFLPDGQVESASLGMSSLNDPRFSKVSEERSGAFAAGAHALEMREIHFPPNGHGVDGAVRYFADTVKNWPIHSMEMGGAPIREEGRFTPHLDQNEQEDIRRRILEHFSQL